MVQLERFWRAFGRDQQWVKIATLTTEAEIRNGRNLVENENGDASSDPYRLVCPLPRS